VLVGSTLLAADNNWPRWRGPADNGSIEAGSYPAELSSHMLWTADLPGKGCSTPIVLNHVIYVTAPADKNDALLAFDWSGKPLWQTPISPDRPGKSKNGSGCNPSPATDGQNLFVYFKSGTLAALNFEGKTLWQTNLQRRFAKDTLYWDIGTSPVLTAKDVVIAVMHHGDSYLAAFDKLTGELHWKIARDYETPIEGDHSYATPILIHDDGHEQLLVWGAQHLSAHDAADGKMIWSVGGFNPDHKNNWVVVGSPVVVGNIAVLAYARGAQLHGIKLGGSGDVTTTNRLWERHDAGCFVPTPAAYKGKVYIVTDKGQVDCFDPTSGATLWTGNLPPKSSKYYSSPTIAGDKLYAAREDGTVFVASIDGKVQVLSEMKFDERLIASPVPVEGRILIRGDHHLFCFGEAKP
jgi:outer membrane protein assembly factor BamB